MAQWFVVLVLVFLSEPHWAHLAQLDLAHDQCWGESDEGLTLLQKSSRLTAGRPHGTNGLLSGHLSVLQQPIYWVHVPKCGSGFANTIIHAPGICKKLPANLLLATGTAQWKPFMEQYGHACKGLAPDGAGHAFGGHDGFGRLYDEYVGKAFIMLRQPEQRIMSGYFFDQSAWPFPTPASDARQYAEVVAGCAVRMLTRSGRWNAHLDPHTSNPCGGPGAPTGSEVNLARKRLREGFAFVGLTDSWALSMCLFHKKFGGDCRSYEMRHMHVGSHNQVGGYDLSPLRGFTDPYDGELWNEAIDIFNRDLERFDVSHSSCKTCFEQARLA